MRQKLLVLGVAVLLLIGAYYAVNSFREGNLGGGYGRTSSDCSISTVTGVEIGPDTATAQTVLAAHSLRAWAQIQVRQGATTTPFLSFDGGAIATIGNGLSLITSTTDSSIRFGLNSDFSYTGSVTAISVATTTLEVTECRY